MSNDTKTVVNGIATFISKENTPPDITITADDGSVSSVSRIFQRQSSQCANYVKNPASPQEGAGPRLGIDNRTPVSSSSSGATALTQGTGTLTTIIEYLPVAEATYFEAVQNILTPSGIVAHYRLDESAAIAGSEGIRDSSGNGYTGTEQGTITYESTTLVTNGGTAVTLNGTDAFVDLGTGTEWNFINSIGTFTVSAWVDFTDPAAADIETVIGNAETVANSGFAIEFDSQVGNDFVRCVVFSNGSAIEVGDSLPADGVHHVVFTGDGSNVYYYLDGSLVDSTAATFVAEDATQSLTIGGNSGSNLWTGRIDEVTISNVFADGTTVTALYDKGTP